MNKEELTILPTPQGTSHYSCLEHCFLFVLQDSDDTMKFTQYLWVYNEYVVQAFIYIALAISLYFFKEQFGVDRMVFLLLSGFCVGVLLFSAFL